MDRMDGPNMDGICCKRGLITSPGEDLMIACRLWVDITVGKPLKLWPVEAVRSASTCNMKQGNTLIHLIIHFQYNFRCNQGSQSDLSIFELALSIRYFIIANILCFSDVCGIQHDDVFIITGGWFTMEIVSKYGKNGWIQDLPKLQTGRKHHGCGHFFSEMNELVKLIIQKMNTTRK